VDNRGIGVRRKIIPMVRAAGGFDLSFEAAEDFLRVVLHGNGANASVG
jgi:ATP-dependent DNA helicase RecG